MSRWTFLLRQGCQGASELRLLTTAADASLPLTAPAVAVWAPSTDVGKSIVCAGLVKSAAAPEVRVNTA